MFSVDPSALPHLVGGSFLSLHSFFPFRVEDLFGEGGGGGGDDDADDVGYPGPSMHDIHPPLPPADMIH